MRYLFFSCICLSCLKLISCSTPYYGLIQRANTHYWEGVLGKDTIKIKDVIAYDKFLTKGLIEIGDSTYSFDVRKYAEICIGNNCAMYEFDDYLMTLKILDISLFGLDDEANALFKAQNKSNWFILSQKPYNSNYTALPHEAKIFKKIALSRQSN